MSEHILDTKRAKETNKPVDYMDVAIRSLTDFAKIDEVYVHFTPQFGEDGALQPNLRYRLLTGMLGTRFPPYLIYVVEDGFNPYNTAIVVEHIEDQALLDIQKGILTPSASFKKQFIEIARKHGYLGAYDERELRGMPLETIWQEVIDQQRLHTTPFLVRRGPRVVDGELLKVLSWNWTQFIEDLLYMGAEKDERIPAASKTLLMPQFREMRRVNSITILMTNPSTGKSTLSEKLGIVVTRTTQKSITGGSKPDGRVVSSFLMEHKRPVTVEQLEAVELEELLAYMLTALSGIPSQVIVYQTSTPFEPYCPLIVSGNPNREKGQPNFEVFFTFIQGISKNYVALGRRVSVILYGNEFDACVFPTGIESMPWIDNLWVIWEAVSNRILPLFKKLYLEKRVQRWIYTPDPEYAATVSSVFEKDSVMVKEFFIDHAKNGFPEIKFRALSSAVVDHGQKLLAISLGLIDENEGWNEVVDGILGTARSTYEYLKSINYRSIKEIAETAELDIKILCDIFTSLPRYLRELLITVAHYAPSLEDTTTFSLEALTPTFNEIKEKLDLYPGLSVIAQALDGYKPRRYRQKLTNFGIALKKPEGSGVWLISLRDLSKFEKFLKSLSLLSALSGEYTPTLKKGLHRKREIEESEETLRSTLTAEVYEDAKRRGLTWIRNPQNRDYEGWAVLDEFQRIVDTATGGKLKGPELVRQMLDEAILELHPIKKGLIRELKREEGEETEKQGVSLFKGETNGVSETDGTKAGAIKRCNECGAVLKEDYFTDPQTGSYYCENHRPHSKAPLQERVEWVHKIVSHHQKLTGIAKHDTVLATLQQDHGIDREEALKLIGILQRDGRVFEPRPGYYKTTGGS